MNYLVELQAAARVAENVLANLTGGESCTICGQTVQCVVSTANALSAEAPGREMTEHGQYDRGVFVFTATKAQFTSEPRNAVTIARPSDPSGQYNVTAFHTEDPLVFVFVCTRHGRRLPG